MQTSKNLAMLPAPGGQIPPAPDKPPPPLRRSGEDGRPACQRTASRRLPRDKPPPLRVARAARP
ncbi:MAG: hypothetical protein LBM92_05825, partial [Opitutaceae bacterium]|nr:hypothetical protein [Opitutaceae bacterium]